MTYGATQYGDRPGSSVDPTGMRMAQGSKESASACETGGSL
jgi:hypothetical protein